MASIDLSSIPETGLVLHFGTETTSISASTFAEALRSFEQAARVLAQAQSPGYEFELIVEATGPGSFRVWLKEQAKDTLFKVVGTVALGLAVSAIYDRYLDSKDITITDNFAIIENGNDRVVIPREIYDKYNESATNEEVEESINEFVANINKDERVEYLGFSLDMDKRSPIEIPRDQFSRMMAPPRRILDEIPNKRTREEDNELVIVIKAVFERGKRKWQFLWRGRKISAPIVDNTFFDRLESREIVFGQGDALVVRVAITEERVKEFNVWKEIEYEITKVYYEVHAHQNEILF